MPNKCQQNNCRKRPTYNIDGERNALYCVIHKMSEMVDVISKRCNYVGCKKQPTYNTEGEQTALYCTIHKKDGMVDVKNKKCSYFGCTKHASYNIDGKTTGLYCFIHKKDEMVDIISKKCVYPNCKTCPVYNIRGAKPLYCFTHKQSGMVDVKHKTCIYPECTIRPTYNIEGKHLALYCNSHKSDEMINVVSKRCNYPNCTTRPTYNIMGERVGLYCVAHREDGMIDVKNKACKTHLCTTLVSKKYDGYCTRCFVYLFPDRPIARNYKTKERSTVEFILQHFPLEHYSWIVDKQIQDGCSRKRPDLILDLGNLVIIIEIDENQHNTYDCSCENKRIMQLSQDVQHRPIVFIRFNPDEYFIKERKKVTSCWGLNGKGICAVKKTKQKEWIQRLHILKEQIKYWINPENCTHKTVEVIQLFYNEVDINE
jgi:hypothetical protein